MVSATKQNVLESKEYIETKVRFNELKALFREVASQQMYDKTREETGIFKDAMKYKKRKQTMTADKAAGVMAKARKIAIFTGDVINSQGGVNFRFDKEEESTTQLFVRKNFVFKPKQLWKWVHQAKQQVDREGPTAIHDEVRDLLEFIKLSGQRTQVMLITSNIDGLHSKSLQDSQIPDFEVFEIDGSINRMHCGRGDGHKFEMLDTDF